MFFKELEEVIECADIPEKFEKFYKIFNNLENYDFLGWGVGG